MLVEYPERGRPLGLVYQIMLYKQKEACIYVFVRSSVISSWLPRDQPLTNKLGDSALSIRINLLSPAQSLPAFWSADQKA